MKRVLIPLSAAAASVLFLSCASCSKKKQAPPPVVVQVPDYKPLSEGWKVQSYALIGIAVIITVGLIARRGNH